MGRGLWSQETTEVPSPHTPSTTKLASEENTDFLHLVNEDADEARLRCAPETNRAAEQQPLVHVRCPCADTNTQNKDLKVNIHAKEIISATAF